MDTQNYGLEKRWLLLNMVMLILNFCHGVQLPNSYLFARAFITCRWCRIFSPVYFYLDDLRDVQLSLPECFASNIHKIATIPRWWFQRFFLFSLYLGKIPSLTTIFQGGWFHQLDLVLHGFMLTDRISFSAKPISFQLQRDPTMLDFFQVPKCKLPGFCRNPIPSMGLVYLPNLPTNSLYKNQPFMYR